jgi:hypothetical protein
MYSVTSTHADIVASPERRALEQARFGDVVDPTINARLATSRSGAGELGEDGSGVQPDVSPD